MAIATDLMTDELLGALLLYDAVRSLSRPQPVWLPYVFQERKLYGYFDADHRPRHPFNLLKRYLSGIVAVNLPFSEPTGDWHYTQTFLRPNGLESSRFLSAGGGGVLGEAGLYDCAPALDAMGVPHPPGPVYAASHARAVADIVLDAIMHAEFPAFAALDDWMPRDEDKKLIT
jgi:hypothetical protein